MRHGTSPSTYDETFAELRDLARGKVGALPPEWVAAVALSNTASADFPVQRAALDAIIRRIRSAERDGLRIKTRPPRGTVLGVYKTMRPVDTPAGGASKKHGKLAERPYETLVAALSPVRASCSCPDFVRNSLGVCKHVLLVVGALFSDKKRVARATREQSASPTGPETCLRWVPDLALLGPVDRAAGLRLELATLPRTGRYPGLVAAPGESRLLVPDASVLRNAEQRLACLQTLGRSCRNIEPAARTVISEELERAERHWLCSKRKAARLEGLATLKRTLYPYQVEGVSRFLAVGRLLLADDMGLGKTTQAIAACHTLHTAGDIRRGLLIVPAALRTQWAREWGETSDVPVAVVDGTVAERRAQYRRHRTGFLIVGYEQLLKDFDAIRAMKADMIVLDEAQRIKNWATKTAVYVKALTPMYRLVLTGTPMENRLEELASILDWVDDVALAPKWRLEPWHTINEGDGASGKSGARHLDSLRARLAPCALRRVRQEVLKQLPARTDTRVAVAMTPQQRDEHDVHTQPIIELMSRGQRRPLTQAEFLKLMQHLTLQRMVSNGLGQLRFEELWPTYQKAEPDPALLEGLFAPKLLELRRLIEDLVVVQDRKVVVFSQWRRMLRLAEWSIRDLLKGSKRRAVFFTGAESQRLRTQSVVEFHDEPAVGVMFLSDAGGVGLNLQRAASACVNLELPWNPAVLEQRIGRIYRLGQRRPINVYNLVNEYGIEARIAALVANKQAVFAGLFDGTTDEVRFEGRRSFMTDVEKLVAAVPADLAQLDVAASLPSEEDGVDVAEDGPLEVADRPETSAPSKNTTPVPLHDGLLLATPVPALSEVGRDTEPATPGLDPIALSELFANVRVQTAEDGSLNISAPPAAAATLAALFETMAKLVGAATRPSR